MPRPARYLGLAERHMFISAVAGTEGGVPGLPGAYADKETGMKTGAGLGLIAVGAILAFAVTAHPSGLNLQAAGWVLIVIGLAGMFVPRRGYGWLRRRMVIPGGRTVVRRGGRRNALPGSVLTEEPGTVVTTEKMDEVPLAGVDPAVYPGRQLSKAEAEEMGLTPVETVEEFRQE
jgi:uncharacterized protein DUF6458